MSGPESSPDLPPHCAAACKEWAGVVRALAEGRQILLLRKGGIAERPAGFAPTHDLFWLYPTALHQAEQGLRAPYDAVVLETDPDTVALDTLARVEWSRFEERPEALDALAGEHVWTEATIRSRFAYRKPGLWVLAVRIFRRAEPWRLPVSRAYAGCKTWVPLEAPLATAGAAPVLDDSIFARRLEQVRRVLDPARS
jgi:hypothetical protein